MKEYILAITTCPRHTSDQLARVLVEKQVAACVNIIPDAMSVYHWKDEITIDSESIVLIKTEARLEDTLKNIIIENHPYELPEFIVLPIKSGSKDYLEWITTSLSE